MPTHRIPAFDGYERVPDIERQGDHTVYKVWGRVSISDDLSSGDRAEEILKALCATLGREIAVELAEERLVK